MVYHGGQFLDDQGQLYVWGKVEEVGHVDVDLISVKEFENSVLCLGYCSVGDL